MRLVPVSSYTRACFRTTGLGWFHTQHNGTIVILDFAPNQLFNLLVSGKYQTVFAVYPLNVVSLQLKLRQWNIFTYAQAQSVGRSSHVYWFRYILKKASACKCISSSTLSIVANANLKRSSPSWGRANFCGMDLVGSLIYIIGASYICGIMRCINRTVRCQ